MTAEAAATLAAAKATAAATAAAVGAEMRQKVADSTQALAKAKATETQVTHYTRT